MGCSAPRPYGSSGKGVDHDRNRQSETQLQAEPGAALLESCAESFLPVVSMKDVADKRNTELVSFHAGHGTCLRGRVDVNETRSRLPIDPVSQWFRGVYES